MVLISTSKFSVRDEKNQRHRHGQAIHMSLSRDFGSMLMEYSPHSSLLLDSPHWVRSNWNANSSQRFAAFGITTSIMPAKLRLIDNSAYLVTSLAPFTDHLLHWILKSID